nr:replication-relaxation family protein [Streptomyces fodineus]
MHLADRPDHPPAGRPKERLVSPCLRHADRLRVARTARLRVGHTLTVNETGLAFLQDARRRGELCRPLDWIPEVHHPIGGGGAVIPDALMY